MGQIENAFAPTITTICLIPEEYPYFLKAVEEEMIKKEEIIKTQEVEELMLIELMVANISRVYEIGKAVQYLQLKDTFDSFSQSTMKQISDLQQAINQIIK